MGNSYQIRKIYNKIILPFTKIKHIFRILRINREIIIVSSVHFIAAILLPCKNYLKLILSAQHKIRKVSKYLNLLTVTPLSENLKIRHIEMQLFYLNAVV